MRKSLKWTVGAAMVAGTLMITAYSVNSQRKVFAQPSDCATTSLNATYGFAFEGYATSGPPGAVKIGAFFPVAAGGTISFQSNGGLNRSFNVSVGGAIFPVSDTGSYTQNPDCTFTVSLPQAGETWNLVPVNGGKQLDFFVNTPGRVGAGTLNEQ
jgi:hypothetical protein